MSLETLLLGSSRSPKVRALAWQMLTQAGRGFPVDARLQALLQARVDALHAEVALLGGADPVRIELLALLLERGLGMAGEVARVPLPREVGAVLVRAGDDAVPAAEALVASRWPRCRLRACARPRSGRRRRRVRLCTGCSGPDRWTRRRSYPSSTSRAISLGQVTLSGRKCSMRHAATQAWHRVHFARLMTIPHLILGASPPIRWCRPP